MKLAAFIPKLEFLATPAFLEDVARGLAYECKVNLIPDEFHTESDPYGNAWASHKKTQSNRLLYKTGDLFNSFSVYSNANGVRITNSLPYAPVHQYGSKKKNIPARPMLPNSSSGLGSVWSDGINRVFKSAVKDALK